MFSDQIMEDCILNFKDDQSLYNWAAFYSVLTWHKVGWALQTKTGKIYETSITQDLVYQFYELGLQTKLPIELYESRNEKANGNDLEFFIETLNGYIAYPVQAKIINRYGKYDKFHYKNKNGRQLDALIEYAERIGGIPLYMFYNFISNSEWHSRRYAPQYKPIEFFGCSFTSGIYLKETFVDKTPGFYDIHPLNGIDIQTFFEQAHSATDDSSIPCSNFIADEGSHIRFYDRESVIDPAKWEDRTPFPSIGRISSVNFGKGLQKREFVSFLHAFIPKFRIVIPLQKNIRRLITMS